MVPLDTILTKSITTAPSSITRFNGVSIAIQGSAASGYSSGEAMEAAKEAVLSVAPAGRQSNGPARAARKITPLAQR